MTDTTSRCRCCAISRRSAISPGSTTGNVRIVRAGHPGTYTFLLPGRATPGRCRAPLQHPRPARSGWVQPGSPWCRRCSAEAAVGRSCRSTVIASGRASRSTTPRRSRTRWGGCSISSSTPRGLHAGATTVVDLRRSRGGGAAGRWRSGAARPGLSVGRFLAFRVEIGFPEAGPAGRGRNAHRTMSPRPFPDGPGRSRVK